METNATDHIQRTGRFCAKYSFLLGSIILFAFVLTGINNLQIVGMIYFIAATFVNLLILFALFIHLFVYPDRYLELLKTMAIMLFNIPVAIFYLWLATSIQHISF